MPRRVRLRCSSCSSTILWPLRFLPSQACYVDELLERLNFDAMSAIGRVVILTTFGDRLESLLQGAGHSAAAI